MARTGYSGIRLIPKRRKRGLTVYGRVKQLDGSYKDTNLTKLGLLSEEDQLRWAERQSGALMKRRREIALGLPQTSGPREAGERFLRDAAGRLSPTTVPVYRVTANRLVAWLEGIGLARLEDLTPAILFAFREHVTALEISPGYRSVTLKNAQTALNWWRKAGLVPGLSRDSIADVLQPGAPPSCDPVAYRPDELRALLAAVAGESWTPRAAVVLSLLLGTRIRELIRLEWDRVALAGEPARVGLEVRLRPEDTKTKRGRAIDLRVSPLAQLFLQRALERRRSPRVLPELRSRGVAQGIVARIRRAGAPAGWTWKHLRSTCGTFLTCAGGIWGGASAYRTARQLGHSVTVAERHYLGVIADIPASADTLEKAMQVEEELLALLG